MHKQYLPNSFYVDLISPAKLSGDIFTLTMMEPETKFVISTPHYQFQSGPKSHSIYSFELQSETLTVPSFVLYVPVDDLIHSC